MVENKKSSFSFRSNDLVCTTEAEKVDAEGTITNIGDLLEPPGRYIRPPKIVIILRGLPGSGKTHFAKDIRTKESDLGSDAPRILDLDAYFEADGEASETIVQIKLIWGRNILSKSFHNIRRLSSPMW